MAVPAQPQEWNLDATLITQKSEHVALVSELIDEVELEKNVAPLLSMVYDEPESKFERNASVRHFRKISVMFSLMVVTSVGNKVFQKLQTIPFYNYPTFVNLFTSFAFIVVSFAYIFPVQRKAMTVTPDQVAVPKRVFVIMGALDGVCGIIQVFAATYLSGSVINLLSQSTIPISILLSALILKKKYSKLQIFGACVVTAGIAVVLSPMVASNGSFIFGWSAALIVSCVPLVLSLSLNTYTPCTLHPTSSLYKEVVLGQKDLDVVYLLGWTTVFQLLVSIPLTIPMARFGDPQVPPSKLFKNLWDGLKCLVGVNTVVNEGKYLDDCWPWAFVYFTAYMAFNIAYNILIVVVLKLGSATALYLALTISIPIGNMIFALPFVPGHTPIRVTDYIGMVLICAGLAVYRFAQVVRKDEDKARVNSMLLSPLIQIGDAGETFEESENTAGRPEISEVSGASASNATKDDSDHSKHVDL